MPDVFDKIAPAPAATGDVFDRVAAPATGGGDVFDRVAPVAAPPAASPNLQLSAALGRPAGVPIIGPAPAPVPSTPALLSDAEVLEMARTPHAHPKQDAVAAPAQPGGVAEGSAEWLNALKTGATNAAIAGAAFTNKYLAPGYVTPTARQAMVRNLAGMQQRVAESHPHDPASRVNQLASGVGTAAATVPLLVAGGPPMAAAGGLAQEGGGALLDVEARRMRGEQVSAGQEAALVAGHGAIGAAMEYVGGKAATKLIPDAVRSLGGGAVRRAATATVGNILAQGGEEGSTTFYQNVYDQPVLGSRAPDLTEGMGAATVGGFGGGVAHAPLSYRAARAQPPPQQQQQPAPAPRQPGPRDVFDRIAPDPFMGVPPTGPLTGLTAPAGTTERGTTANPPFEPGQRTPPAPSADSAFPPVQQPPTLTGDVVPAAQQRPDDRQYAPAPAPPGGQPAPVARAVAGDQARPAPAAPDAGAPPQPAAPAGYADVQPAQVADYPDPARRYSESELRAMSGSQTKQLLRAFVDDGGAYSPERRIELILQAQSGLPASPAQQKSPTPSVSTGGDTQRGSPPPGVPVARADESVPPTGVAVKSKRQRAAKTPFTKAAVERKLMDRHEQQGGGFTADDDAQLASFYGIRGATTFYGKLPGEIEHYKQNNPAAEKLFTVTEDRTRSHGQDAMHELGDRYWQILDNITGNRIRGAKETLRKDGDPGTQFWLAVHDNLPAFKNRPRQQAVDPTQLQVGQEFELNGSKFQVVEDADGYRILKDGDEYPATPVDALAGEKIPVDQNTLTEPKEPEVPEGDPFADLPAEERDVFDRVTAQTAPKMTSDVTRQSEAPTSDTGVFGQWIPRPATGKQQGGLFHEPVTVEGPKSEVVGSKAANDPRNTPEMFGAEPPRPPEPPDPNESVDDRSRREFVENAHRVAANPEAASMKDLIRARSYQGRRLEGLHKDNADPEVIRGVESEIDHYSRLIHQKEAAGERANQPPTAGPAKSRGHIRFVAGREYFLAADGTIMVGRKSAPLDKDGYRSDREKAPEHIARSLKKAIGEGRVGAEGASTQVEGLQPKLDVFRASGTQLREAAAKGDAAAQAEIDRRAARRGTPPPAPTSDSPAEPAPPKPSPLVSVARSFRGLADGMQGKIDAQFNPGVANQNPTARRARIAEGMYKEGERLKKIQGTLRNLADAMEAGTLPESLRGLRTRAQVEELMRERYPQPYGNPRAIRMLLDELKGKPGIADVRQRIGYLGESGALGVDQAEAVADLMKLASKYGKGSAGYNISIDGAKRLAAAGIHHGEDFNRARTDLAPFVGEAKADPRARIRQMEAKLLGRDIPGFFPTPKPVIDRMIEQADIRPGMSVLEPSAGKGDIVEGIVQRFRPKPMESPGSQSHPQITAIEASPDLANIVSQKAGIWRSGSDAGVHVNVENADFLRTDEKYDRIVMNPPFEKGQDIEHVRHAYDLLKPGGKLVSVMSEGPFFRNDAKAAAFREWLEEVGGGSEQLPAGSFTGKDAFRQTGTATRLVTIDKAVESVSDRPTQGPGRRGGFLNLTPLLPDPPAPTVGERFNLSNEALWDTIRRKVQDEFLPLRRMQEDVRRQGGTVTDASDAYLKQELFKGKAAEQIRQVEHRYVRPIIDRMTAAGLTLEQVDEYLYAKHAQERNAQVATVNPNMAGGGSGMSDAQAEAIIDKAKATGKWADLEDIADRVYALNDDTLTRMVNEGLVTQEAADAMRYAYQFYVPLRTDMEAEGANLRPGQGFNVRGPEGKRAMGRQSLADSPLTFSLMQAQEKIVRAEKNKVGRALLKFVRSNPDPDLWKVNDYPMTRTIDPNTGLVRDTVDMRFQTADDVVSVKEGGKQHLIEFKGEAGQRIAAAVKRLGYQDGGRILGALHKVMRFYASLQTNWNPDFLLPNLVRDVQAAALNLSSEQSVKMARAVVNPKNWARAAKAVFQVSGDPAAKSGGAYHDAMREYLRHGGKVDTYALQDFQETGKQLDRMLKDASPTRGRKLVLIVKKTGEMIDRVNGAVETATRLSAYVEARRAGMSPERAASLAKNLTVNFNRKGEYGQVLNSLYLFSNASIQGNARMLRALAKSNRGRAMALGILGAGLAYGLAAPLLFGEDEEGRDVWDTIPEQIRATNLLIPTGGKKYIKIPLPYGFNTIFSAGRLTGETATGNIGPGEAAASLLNASLNAFNPLGNEGSPLQTLSPTIADPLVQHFENKDWTGRPIVPEQNPFAPPKPDSQVGRRDTSPLAKAFAEWFNTATGGDEVTPGAVDVSPATIQHFVEWVIGGTGRFFSKGVDVTEAAVKGELPTANRLPIASRFVGEPPAMQNFRDFYDALDKAEDATSDLKYYEKAGQAGKAEALRRSREKDLQFYRWARKIQQDGAKLKRERGEDVARAEIEKEMKEFLRAYNKGLPPRVQ